MTASNCCRGGMPLSRSADFVTEVGALPFESPGRSCGSLPNPEDLASSVLDFRRSGVLLHISSLPGSGGCGTLGIEARRFVDFLCDAGFSVWQTLPINPPHADGSPYQCLSVHAGNPALIDPEWLVEQGWISSSTELRRADGEWMRVAFEAFRQRFRDVEPTHSSYQRFLSEHEWWLADYTLYMAIREECGHDPWQEWPVALRDRWPAALQAARRRLASTIARFAFEQYLFFTQWGDLRDYARSRGVVLFGDMPIFVAADSADVWSSRHYFDLDPLGYPRVVAGVPPDYFSATGQRWGNPHYDWAAMESDGFSWWVGRLRSQLELYDWVRIDHFRGFEAYWEIPADSDTAIQGRWIKAPGDRLLETFQRVLDGGGLPLVAEDLGIITDEVEALRDRFSLPGMKILQFAFDGGPTNPYLPHHHPPNCVVYTGTHDNDTTLGWFEGLDPDQQHAVYEYLGCPEIPMPWALVRCALASEAGLAMLPMQDLLGLGAGFRMNTPGTVEGNWQWRYEWSQVTPDVVQCLKAWNYMYERTPNVLVQAPTPGPGSDLQSIGTGV